MLFDWEFRGGVRRQVRKWCADNKIEVAWRKAIGNVAAYSATAQQNSLTRKFEAIAHLPLETKSKDGTAQRSRKAVVNRANQFPFPRERSLDRVQKTETRTRRLNIRVFRRHVLFVTS